MRLYKRAQPAGMNRIAGEVRESALILEWFSRYVSRETRTQNDSRLKLKRIHTLEGAETRIPLRMGHSSLTLRSGKVLDSQRRQPEAHKLPYKSYWIDFDNSSRATA